MVSNDVVEFIHARITNVNTYEYIVHYNMITRHNQGGGIKQKDDREAQDEEVKKIVQEKFARSIPSHGYHGERPQAERSC